LLHARGAGLNSDARGPLPGLDDRLVQPETREEMLRGRRIYAAPALPPHADRHSALNYTIEAHAADSYITSSDLLTRTSHDSDFATDTSVRRAGIDPSTGGRYLEELAFEIVNTQSLREICTRGRRYGLSLTIAFSNVVLGRLRPCSHYVQEAATRPVTERHPNDPHHLLHAVPDPPVRTADRL
jgi:hypothetical protein